MYDKYINFLRYKFISENYWSDQCVIEAIYCLEQFNQQDWVLLRQSITVKNTDNIEDITWLVACAETLSDIDASIEISYLLFELLNIKNIEIKIAALDSLRSKFVDIYSYYTDDQKYIIRQIVSSLADLDNVYRMIVDDLKKELRR